MRTLETKRLILRALTADDTQKIFDNWACDPEVPKYMTWYAHESVDFTRKIVEQWLEDYKKDDCYRYVIERKEDSELMGMIDVVTYLEGVPVIGYCLGKNFWGNGYMTEAVRAVVAELFDAGYGAVRVDAVKENIRSNRVIQKAGFRLLETVVRPLSAVKPEPVTENLYILTKEEWASQTA